MRSVEVSDDIYKRLLRRAASFEDDAEAVIARLLDETEPVVHARLPVEKTTRGILPLGEYWLPILEILADAGGAAPARDVISELEERLGERLSEVDRMPVRSGEPRWKNRARFARLRMKEQGFLSSPSRGIWAITAAGRRHITKSGDAR